MFFWRARWFKPWPNFVDSRLLEVTFSTFDSRVTFLPSQKGHERKNLILKKDGAIFFVDFYGTLVGKYTSPMNPMWGCYKGCHLGLVLKLLVDVHLLNWSSGLILWFVFVSIRVYDVFFPRSTNTLGQLIGLDGIFWLFQHPLRLWKDQIAPIWAAMSQEERHLV